MDANIEKALEAASSAVLMERNHSDYPCNRGDIDDNMARAAVVAFLRAMPDGVRIDVPARQVGFIDMQYTPASILAAIEGKEG